VIDVLIVISDILESRGSSRTQRVILISEKTPAILAFMLTCSIDLITTSYAAHSTST